MLLAEGREEFNLEKAKETYKEVQKTIWKGEQLELYSDVSRLLPEHIKPQCLEKKMEIQEYIRDEGKKKTASNKEPISPAKGKRKRNDDVNRNIPTGASTGFVSVADLLVKGAKKQKTVPRKAFDVADQDDDTDMEIESGLVVAIPRRTKSSAPKASKPATEKAKLRRSKTNAPKGKKKTHHIEPTSSQFSSKGIDDIDDIEIEKGLIVPLPSTSSSRQSTSPSSSVARPESPPQPPAPPVLEVIDLSDSDDIVVHENGEFLSHLTIPLPHRTPIAPPPDNGHDRSMAWLVDDDDDPDFEIVDSSPIANRRQTSLRKSSVKDEFIEHDESIEFVRTSKMPNFLHGQRRIGHASRSPDHTGTPPEADDSIEFIQTTPVPSPTYPSSSPMWPNSSSPTKPIHAFDSRDMPPPILPRHLSSPFTEQDMPEPSFPVRPGPKRRRPVLESPYLEVPLPSQRRLHRRYSPPAQNPPRKHKSPPRNDLFDVAAIHSGDEVSEGSSGSEDEEDEEDRLFLKEVPETQVSPSYDQTLAYRQSLFTQAPVGARAPAFANGPVRRGVLGRLGVSTRPRLVTSSSPPREDDNEPDEYALGSFVVDDDAEISYLSD